MCLESEEPDAEELQVEVNDIEGSGSDGEEPAPKRRRRSRKPTAWLFVEHNEESKTAVCLLGCLNKYQSARLVMSLSGPPFNLSLRLDFAHFLGTNTIMRHAESKHPFFLERLRKVRNNEYSLERLKEEISTANEKTLESLKKKKLLSDKFFRRIDSGLEKRVKCDLELMLWAISNGVSRSALNCVLFDRFLQDIGAVPAANRHDLQQEHLMQLDLLVRRHYEQMLKSVRSVSISSVRSSFPCKAECLIARTGGGIALGEIGSI